VLDKRLLSKGYGSSFLDSLPDCTVCHGPLNELPARAVSWIDGSQAD
jgi:DNA polymerase-3 subunit epsilon/ATP-dependent DNA helicase DinG